MEPEASAVLNCIADNYNKSFDPKEAEAVVTRLKQQAIRDGFVLSSCTGKKQNSIRFQCHRSELPR